MVKKIALLLIMLPLILKAQDTPDDVVSKGLLRATGTLGIGGMTKHEQTNIYILGLGEYFVNDQNTIRCDLYYYIKSGNKQMLQLNHQLFAGSAYHFNTSHNFVPYVGLQPGLALTQADYVTIDKENNIELSPLISTVVGFNYFASNYFHLFIDGRYVSGKHLSNQKKIDLDEFRISFGLGFNINILSKK